MLNRKLLEWMKSKLNEVQRSPRKEVFTKGREPQDFKIVSVEETKKRIKIQFMKSGTLLPLEFWRLEKVIAIISKGGWVRLSTRFYAEDPSTIEWQLQDTAKKLYPNRRVDVKTAPHICDILVLAGIAEYGFVQNPYTKRLNQAIKTR